MKTEIDGEKDLLVFLVFNAVVFGEEAARVFYRSACGSLCSRLHEAFHHGVFESGSDSTVHYNLILKQCRVGSGG